MKNYKSSFIDQIFKIVGVGVVKYIFVLISCFIVSCSQSKHTIGIIAAMKEEIQDIVPEINDLKEIKRGSNTYYTGSIGDKNVIVVFGGIGMVNAAMTTTSLIEYFNAKTIIMTGVALSADDTLNIGDMVIPTNFSQYFVDHTVFDIPYGHISREDKSYFPADTNLINFVFSFLESEKKENYKISKGSMSSGDLFVNYYAVAKQINEMMHANSIDMESAAAAQVAYKYNIPFLVIKTINNTMGIKEGDFGNSKEYLEFLDAASQNSSLFILKLLKSNKFPY